MYKSAFLCLALEVLINTMQYQWFHLLIEAELNDALDDWTIKAAFLFGCCFAWIDSKVWILFWKHLYYFVNIRT